MGHQMLSHIAFDAGLVLAGIMRAAERFFTAMAALVYLENLLVGKPFVAVFKRAAVRAVSCMAGQVIHQIAGEAELLATGLVRAGARFVLLVEMQVACKVAQPCKVSATRLKGTDKAQPCPRLAGSFWLGSSVAVCAKGQE